ncbi:MAG TPA: hypothetical protein PK156_49070 [Polyangium sp.]|nr:hypothetical protein [Polyangium sp.]
MGTWGEGLYDNDSALDSLGDLLQIEDEVQDIVELTARIGLAAWLNPTLVICDAGDLKARVDALSGQHERLPEATRQVLATLFADPETALKDGSRKPEAHAVIGGYCDGPQIEPLLKFPAAQPIIEAFGETMAKELDAALAPKKGNDLYQAAGELAPLGILIELSLAGFFQPAPGRVAAWRDGFTVIDKATKSERGFWWKYVRKVQAGFDLLAPRPQNASAAKPVVQKPRNVLKNPEPSAPAGPVERYSHPKLGVGILVARSGSGDEEKLDLRFDDGGIRKILAKFVTRLEE